MLINKTKSSLFTVDERIDMLREVVAPTGNVEVDAFHGLLVDYCRDRDDPGDRQGPARRSATSTTSCRWRR